MCVCVYVRKCASVFMHMPFSPAKDLTAKRKIYSFPELLTSAASGSRWQRPAGHEDWSKTVSIAVTLFPLLGARVG